MHKRRNRTPRSWALGLLFSLITRAAVGQPEFRFFPVRTAPIGSAPGTIGEPVTPVFNNTLGCRELQVLAGVEVHIDIQPSGWGDAPGDPTLGALQATVDPAGYSNGLGADLVPKGWPENPSVGIFLRPHCMCRQRRSVQLTL